MKVSIGDDMSFSTMMWAYNGEVSKSIYILPEMVPAGEAIATVEVFFELNLIASSKKTIRFITAPSPHTTTAAELPPIEIEAEMDRSEYIVDLYDPERIDASGSINIANLNL